MQALYTHLRGGLTPAEVSALASTAASSAITADVPALVDPLITNDILSREYFRVTGGSFGGVGVSGAGAATNIGEWGLNCIGPTTAVGYAFRRFAASATYASLCIGKAAGVINWTKKVTMSVGVTITNSHANAIVRVSLGKTIGDGQGALARRAFSFIRSGTGVVQLQVHNGTSLTTSSNGTFTPTSGQKVFYRVEATNGSSVLYANGVQVASCSGSPTDDSGATENAVYLEVENTGITTAQITAAADMFIIKFDQ